MANPDGPRILGDERSLLEAENALAREEQALWQRLATLPTSDNDATAEALLARLTVLEKSGVATPDLARAKEVVIAAAAPDDAPAATERLAALEARRDAIKAREVAAKAIAAAIEQVDKQKKRVRKQLEAVETFVAGSEAALKAFRENQRKAAAAKAAEATPPPAPPAPVKVEAPVALTPKVRAPPPAVVPPPVVAPPPPVAPPVVATPKTPAPPPVVPPSIIVEPEPVEAAPKAKPAPAAPAKPAPAPKSQPAPVAKAATVGRKVSRRRRVRLAPPPRKIEIEIAVFGENNFYTGFENRIGGGGVFVASQETLPRGHELEVELDLEGRKIATRGRVEFTRIDNPISVDCTPGAGLKLLNLSSDNATAIEQFFRKRVPMFYAAVQ